MKKKFARIAGVILAAALACSIFAGCGNDAGKAALTVNGEKMPYGEALFVLRTNQAEVYYTMLSTYYSGGAFWSEEYTPEGEEEPVVYGEYFKNEVQKDLVKLMLLRQKAEEYGVAVDETDKEKTESLASDFMASNEELAKQLGFTYDYVLDALQMYALKPKMRMAMTTDVDTEVSDEEADMTTLSYVRIPIPSEDAEEEAEEETEEDNAEEEEEPAKTKEELYADCEKVLALFKEAGDMDYDALNEMADAVNEDFFGMVYSYSPQDAPFDEAILDAVATLEDGQVYDGVIDIGDYFYLVRLEKLHDPEKIESKKEQIVNERRTELFDSILDEWVGEADVTVDAVWTDTVVNDNENYLSTQFTEGEASSW